MAKIMNYMLYEVYLNLKMVLKRSCTLKNVRVTDTKTDSGVTPE